MVRVRYEPSRVGAACLADAYEQVVPSRQRRAPGRAAPPARTEMVPLQRGGGTTR
jgi:hypothetical protein